jgi:hypothetical protein
MRVVSMPLSSRNSGSDDLAAATALRMKGSSPSRMRASAVS